MIRLKACGFVIAAVVIGMNSPAKADTAQEQREAVIKRYVEVFNKGAVPELEQFFSAHFAPEALRGRTPAQAAARELNFKGMLGGSVDLVRVTGSGDSVSSVTKTSAEFPTYVRAEWKFDPANPERVVSRMMIPGNPPDDLLPPRSSALEVGKEVNAKLRRLEAAGQFSGAALIAADGKPVWQAAYGLANRESGIRNTVNTRFRLGSMNKMFTAVSIAQLVQAGKLKYTDTLASVLPDYPNQEAARKITIHNLLTHTSGLGDFFGPEFDKSRLTLHELKDYVPLFASKPLEFEPGKGWSYSNAGFLVLGLVVEHISGQSYYDYVKAHIFDPAGMTGSGSSTLDDKDPRLAIGYTKMGPSGKIGPNRDMLPWRGSSAGGGESTLGDLLRFDRALRSHLLLNEEQTNLVMEGKTQPGPDPHERYGYGFEDNQIAGHRTAGHGGGAEGMNAELDMYRDNGCTVVVLANMDPPAAQSVAGYIRTRIK